MELYILPLPFPSLPLPPLLSLIIKTTTSKHNHIVSLGVSFPDCAYEHLYTSIITITITNEKQVLTIPEEITSAPLTKRVTGKRGLGFSPNPNDEVPKLPIAGSGNTTGGASINWLTGMTESRTPPMGGLGF